MRRLLDENDEHAALDRVDRVVQHPRLFGVLGNFPPTEFEERHGQEPARKLAGGRMSMTPGDLLPRLDLTRYMDVVSAHLESGTGNDGLMALRIVQGAIQRMVGEVQSQATSEYGTEAVHLAPEACSSLDRLEAWWSGGIPADRALALEAMKWARKKDAFGLELQKHQWKVASKDQMLSHSRASDLSVSLPRLPEIVKFTDELLAVERARDESESLIVLRKLACALRSFDAISPQGRRILSRMRR